MKKARKGYRDIATLSLRLGDEIVKKLDEIVRVLNDVEGAELAIGGRSVRPPRARRWTRSDIVRIALAEGVRLEREQGP